MTNMCSLGGIARKPRPISTERCSMNVFDMADIFTVDRPHAVKKKSKISAQTHEPVLRYRAPKFWFLSKVENCFRHYFAINFDFLENSKRYRWDFFIRDTIDDGLSFDNNKNRSTLYNGSLVLFAIFRRRPLVYKVN